MSTFTPEVLQSFDVLRRAIDDVHSTDAGLAQTLTAVVDDLVENLESQMLLMFANVGIKRKEDEADLLRARSDEPLLEYYNNAAAGPETANLEVDPTTGKLAVVSATLVSAPPASDGASRGPTQSTSRGKTRSVAEAPHRTVLGATHLMLEAIGHHLQAERTTLYLLQKGTGTLRVVGSAPDTAPVQRAAFLPAHVGIPGAVFSTGIGVVASHVDDETRRSFVVPTDQQLGVDTATVIAFPILDRTTNTPLGVVECANKVKGAAWSAADEELLFDACRLLRYIATHHDLDLHATAGSFSPAQLHAIKAFSVSPFDEALRDWHDASHTLLPQHVVRLTKTNGGRGVPGLGRGRKATEPQATPEQATGVARVREVRRYLAQMEDTQRHLMQEVAVQQRAVQKLRSELGQQERVAKVAEDNAASLQEALHEARGKINAQSFHPMQGANAAEFGPDLGTSATLGAFITGDGQSTSLPPLRRGSIPTATTASEQVPLEPDVQQLMTVASDAIAKLKRITLAEASPEAQRLLLRELRTGGRTPSPSRTTGRVPPPPVSRTPAPRL